MQRRALGTSGFEISTIGIGTWATGGWMWGGQDDEASIQAIHAAVDHGVNWIDTAPIYGSGHSEVVVGRALQALPAARRPLVFTKFGLGENSEDAVEVGDAGGGARRVRRQPAAPRRRRHRPLPAALAGRRSRSPRRRPPAPSCSQAGKIRAIGVSNYSVAQLEEWRATGVPLHSVQSPYSILRPAVAADVLPYVRQDRHRRHRLLAAVPRPAVRHLEEGQDVPRGRRPRRPQGLPGRPLRSTPRRRRRSCASSPPTAA